MKDTYLCFVELLACVLCTELQSLKVLNLGFNKITGAILVHLKGKFFWYCGNVCLCYIISSCLMPMLYNFVMFNFVMFNRNVCLCYIIVCNKFGSFCCHRSHQFGELEPRFLQD